MPRRSSKVVRSEHAAGVGAREGSGRWRPLTGFLMSTRSIEHTIVFRRSFSLSAVDGPLPSGRYRVITEEEPLEGLSFAAWRRVCTLLLLPANSLPGKAREVVPIDPNELEASLAADGLESL